MEHNWQRRSAGGAVHLLESPVSFTVNGVPVTSINKAYYLVCTSVSPKSTEYTGELVAIVEIQRADDDGDGRKFGRVPGGMKRFVANKSDDSNRLIHT